MKKLYIFLLSVMLVLPISYANAFIPNDEFFQDQWYLRQIDATTAWDTQQGSSKVVVAVLDTGVDLDHQDLASRIFVNSGEIADDGIDNDGNGFVDDVKGWDFYDNDNDANPVPTQDMDFGVHHGTVVAGLIGAAGNNSVGVSGVNIDVRILPIRVLDSIGDGTGPDVVRGIDYAVAMGADVINMSFVGNDNSSSLNGALQRAFDKNIVVVAAMGNTDGGGTNLDHQRMYPVCSPGDGYDDIVIGVTATNSDDSKASFSNYGGGCADIAAPGKDILATQVASEGKAYGSGWEGTSLATPLVAGAAALMKASYPNATPTEIKIAMQLSVDPIQGGSAIVVGAMGSGRLNVARALELLPQLVSDKTQRVVTKVTSSTVTQGGVQPLVVGAGAGDKPLVTVFKSGNTSSWFAYAEGFRGGVKVASGQLDGESGYEIVTGAGAGGGPHVRVFDDSGNLKAHFFAYESSFSGGVDVTTGDVNGDGVDEIIVVPGEGRSAVARVFTMTGELVDELELAENGNAFNVSAGDMTGDGIDELIITESLGGDPMVWVYDLTSSLVSEFPVYGANMNRGVRSTVVSANGTARIVSGTERGAGPQVRLFNRIGALANQYFAFGESNRDGVDVASWDQNGDGNEYVVTSGIQNGLPTLRVYNTNSVQIDASLPLIGYTERVNI